MRKSEKTGNRIEFPLVIDTTKLKSKASQAQRVAGKIHRGTHVRPAPTHARLFAYRQEHRPVVSLYKKFKFNYWLICGSGWELFTGNSRMTADTAAFGSPQNVLKARRTWRNFCRRIMIPVKGKTCRDMPLTGLFFPAFPLEALPILQPATRKMAATLIRHASLSTSKRCILAKKNCTTLN